MFLPKWCAHCIVVPATFTESVQGKKRVLPSVDFFNKNKFNTNNQQSRPRSHLFGRMVYQELEETNTSASTNTQTKCINKQKGTSVKTTNETDKQHQQDTTAVTKKKKRSSLIVTNDYLNHNKYELKSWLGSGGFGRVYAAVRLADSLPVAIKYVNRWKVVDWDVVNGEKVPLEYSLLLSASPVPGVVRALDCFDVGKDHVAIVTELLEPCRDLYDLLVENGPLPLPLARHYFRQIVRAVVGCHRLGVLHRDIKAENVIIHCKTHVIKLIDFGCGAFDDKKTYDRLIGTRDYYAPEMLAASGPSYRAEEVTVWSLGVLLYAMVCGELPFKTKRDILAAYYEFPSRSTSDWMCADLINQMLQKNPNHRRHLGDILHHQWLIAGDDFTQTVRKNQRSRSPEYARQI